MSDPVSPREARARQAVLARGTLDVWRAKFDKYHTTAQSCMCTDYQVHWRQAGFECKHMIALRLLGEGA
jgi:hypothetical protein